MDKEIAARVIDEMRRVRDDVMPEKILEEFRGSRQAKAQLAALRQVLDDAVAALSEQNTARCLDVYGQLKTL